MAGRVTYGQVAQFAAKTSQQTKVLSPGAQGGPVRVKYQPGGTPNSAEADPEWQAEHPRYPDYLYPEDSERDTRMQIKSNLARDPTRLGYVMATDADVQYVRDKKDAQQLALFKQFVENSLPRGTPWAKDYFDRIWPGWYQSKQDIINSKMGLINKFIDMSIRGVQNMEDLELLFDLYTGKIELPTNFTELVQGTKNNEIDYNQFASGFFNPKRYISDAVRISARNQKFMANFAIPGIDVKNLTSAAGLATTTTLADELKHPGWMTSKLYSTSDDNYFTGAFGKNEGLVSDKEKRVRDYF
jgi:hypothetical protein